MKKYLFFSLVFAATIAAFTSCSKSSDVYDPGRPEQDAQDLYKKNFLAYVEGPINGAVDWGFGSATVKSGTRADGPDTTKVVLDSEGYSSMFYNDFFATVESTFPQNAVCTDKTWYNYEFHERGKFCNIRLIYTNTSLKDEIGLYYYDPTKETYENAKEIKLIEDLQEADLGYYFQYNRYKDLDEYWEDPKKTDAYSKWHRDPNPVVRLQSRTWTVYMNGDYYFGIYVRNMDAEGKTHTYYTNQFKNADENAYSGAAIGDVSKGDVEKCYVFGVSDDNQPNCNLLFAIIQAGEDGLYPELVKPEKKDPEPTPEPPTPEPPTPTPEPVWYRIIAEDLNAHDLPHDGLDGIEDDTDFDFNDIVLDVQLTETGANCKLQAAGATLKICINGDDNLEVHKMFGVDQKVMVNTNADKAGLANAKKDPVEFSLTGNFKSADDILIQVFRQNKWMTLKAPKGDAASKIVVPITFVWPDERQSLKAKYPDFLNYVKDPEAYREWWNKVVK